MEMGKSNYASRNSEAMASLASLSGTIAWTAISKSRRSITCLENRTREQAIA